MDARRQLAVFLLAWSLLSACLCTQPTRSGRQKRGLMKMMMHIAWDPVRLIRYWHVYDVSKEIAKSWRKILPTIMLLPVTNNNPHSYPGIAKYVHPTIGFKGSRNHNSKHANMPHYHKAAGSVPSVAVPKLVHPALLPHYALASDMMQHYYSSKVAASPGVQNDFNSMQPVIVGHVPYGEGGEQHTVAHYYMKDSNLLNHKISPFEGNAMKHNLNVHDEIRSASSQHIPRAKESISGYGHSSSNHIHYVPHLESQEPTVHDDSEKGNTMVLQPGQEFHIVLHPIPVSDFDPSVLKPPSKDHEIQYVPVRSQSHDYMSPILFKAVHADEHEDVQYVHDRHYQHQVSDSGKEAIDRSESSSVEEEQESSTKNKHGVTWVQKKSKRRKSPGKRKNTGDLTLDGSVKRVLSIQKFAALKEESKKNATLAGDSKVRKTFGMHRFNINMEQLREDLKHGTPVLIPFNKNGAHSSRESTGGTEDVQQVWTTQSSIPTSVPAIKDHTEKEQGHSGELQNNQRLLLFLKKNVS